MEHGPYTESLISKKKTPTKFVRANKLGISSLFGLESMECEVMGGRFGRQGPSRTGQPAGVANCFECCRIFAARFQGAAPTHLAASHTCPAKDRSVEVDLA